MTAPKNPGVYAEHGYAFDLIDLKACCKKRGPAYQEMFFWEAAAMRPIDAPLSPQAGGRNHTARGR